jgi:hypothetical protein
MPIKKAEPERLTINVAIEASEGASYFKMRVTRQELAFLERLAEQCKKHRSAYGPGISWWVK